MDVVDEGPSAVAGIVDRNGGIRVVVTQKWRMKHHVGKGEKLYVVPNLLVQEPVFGTDQMHVIRLAEEHTKKAQASWRYRLRSRWVQFTSAIARLGQLPSRRLFQPEP